MERIDCAVVGAGVVGLSAARALALQGREVVVLESAATFGTGTSSRNSEVIHAGIYYPQGSLKASLCVAGRVALYQYLHERALPHRRCGKLIVATDPGQVHELHRVRARALANGVSDIELLSADEAKALEPDLCCVAALHSPSTGIVDSHALMLSLLGDVERAGGVIAFRATVTGGEICDSGVVLRTADEAEWLCRTVVNAAGLNAPALAAGLVGLPANHVPKPYWAKGNYFVLAGAAPFTRLIYPLPDEAGLGVHLTLDLAGQAKFGPDVQWVSSPDDLQVDGARGDAFYSEVRKYWPQLPDGALMPGYAGIRPKLGGRGAPAGDFLIDGPDAHGIPGLVNLFGIESPGLTSCLSIGAHVADLLHV